jgi:hypothetical protein
MNRHWDNLWPSRSATPRTQTMIALRARREALEVARSVAYPQLNTTAQPPLVRRMRLPVLWWWGSSARRVYPVIYLAPGWMIWLLAGSIGTIVVAAVLILSKTR